MGQPIDATAKSDFAALAAKYEAMQKQAFTTQDVAAPTVADLRSSLDTYMTAHVVDDKAREALIASQDKVFTSMATTVDQQQNYDQLNNEGWENDTAALEALFAQIMPEGAEAVYSPLGKGAEQPADASDAKTAPGDGKEPIEAGEGETPEASEPKKTTPATEQPESLGQDQSGAGWGGADLLDPKTSATYKGLSLEGLLAVPDSLVAQELGHQPDVLAAIRRVSAETGVPSGLMAAMIIQESNGDRTTISGHNPGYSSKPQDQQVDAGLIQSPLWAFEGATTAEKRKNSEDPYTNLSIFAQEAKRTFEQTGSWGQVAQVWYTGAVAERLGGVSAGGSDETNYVLNVLGNLGMGASTYYPKDGS